MMYKWSTAEDDAWVAGIRDKVVKWNEAEDEALRVDLYTGQESGEDVPRTYVILEHLGYAVKTFRDANDYDLYITQARTKVAGLPAGKGVKKGNKLNLREIEDVRDLLVDYFLSPEE